MKKPVYLGIFLTEQAKRQLLQKFPPLHDTVHNDHVTLVYKPNAEQIASFVPGEKMMVKIIGYAEDEKGQAVTVSLPPGYKKDSGIAHVTLTTAPGVPPAYSNDLLLKAKPVPSFTVEGVTDYFPRTNMKKVKKITEQQLRHIIRSELLREVSRVPVEVINADTGEVLTVPTALAGGYVPHQTLSNGDFEQLRRLIVTRRVPPRSVTADVSSVSRSAAAASATATAAALSNLHAAAKEAALDFWEENSDYDLSIADVAEDLAAGLKYSVDAHDWKLGLAHYDGDSRRLITALAETMAEL